MASSGMTLERLQVLIEAETKPFREELAKMQAQVNTTTAQVERSTSRIRKAFAGLKGIIVGLGLVKLGKDAIIMASDLQEVQNVVDTAFGDMAYKCEEFAKTAIKQFGMSELSAKQTSSTFMAMGKGIGMSSSQASDMAIELAKLSGDAASFFNISQSEAATKLKSVYTGETETLKDLGVVMTQTNLKQFAMNNGLSSNIESMDQASLTALRYKFVTEQLALAQGDFAKTSSSWANQTRILSEQWKQLLGIIGNGLVAVFTPVIQVLNMVLGKIIQFANTVSAVLSSLFGKKGKTASDSTNKISSSLGAAEDNAGGLNTQLDKTTGKANKAAKAIGQLASIDEINNMSSSSGGDSGASGGAGGISAGGIDTGDWNAFSEEFETTGIDKTVEKIKNKLNDLKSFLEKHKAAIISVMSGIVASLGTLWMIKNWGTLVGPIANVFTWLSNLMKVIAVGPAGWQALITSAMGVSAPMVAIVLAVTAVVTALVYLWQTSDGFRSAVGESLGSLMGILQNIYDSVLVPLFAFLADIFNTVLVPIATFIAQVVVKAVEAVSLVVMALWNNVLAPIVNFLVSIMAVALQGVINTWEAWKPQIEAIGAACQWVWDNVLSPLVDWIVDFLIATFEKWGNVLSVLIPDIISIFQGLIDFFVNVFTGDLDKCWQGITEIFEGFDNFLTDIFATDWSESFGFFGDILNGFFANVKGIWDSIKKVFQGLIDFVAGTFTGDWKRAWEGLKNIVSGIFGGLASIVKAPLNAVIGLFNGLLDGINWCIGKINSISVDLPDWLGGAHIGFSIPTLGKISYLARGGVVDKPTPAIFGEAGAEAVIPLENNTGWMAKIAQGITGHLRGYANSDLEDLLILMQELIDIVREKDPTIYVELDEDKLSGVNRKAERLRKLRTG